MNYRKRFIKKLTRYLSCLLVAVVFLLAYIAKPESTTFKSHTLPKTLESSSIEPSSRSENKEIPPEGSESAINEAKSTQLEESSIETTNAPESEAESLEDNTNSHLTGLTVYFLDVGQADSAVICADGEYMMIDAGNNNDAQFIYSWLQNHNITHLKYFIGTHVHEDHIGGAAAVLNAVTVDDLIMCSENSFDSKTFYNFDKYTKEQGKEIYIPAAGETYSLGNATFTILAPLKIDADNHNNNSIVARLVYGNISILFTGDMEEGEEGDLLATGVNLKADVLKVAHHGSSTSSSSRLLEAVHPTYSIISSSTADKQNYDHPDIEVLNRLKEIGTTLYRTDKQGSITLSSDGSNISIAPERNTSDDMFSK